MKFLSKLSVLTATALMLAGSISAAQAVPEVRVKVTNQGATTINRTSGSVSNGTAIVALPSSIAPGAAPTGRYSVPLNFPANGSFIYTATGGHSCGFSYSRNGSCVMASVLSVQQSAGSVCNPPTSSVSGSGNSCINSVGFFLQ